MRIDSLFITFLGIFAYVVIVSYRHFYHVCFSLLSCCICLSLLNRINLFAARNKILDVMKSRMSINRSKCDRLFIFNIFSAV
jgi:hypothetical protein